MFSTCTKKFYLILCISLILGSIEGKTQQKCLSNFYVNTANTIYQVSPNSKGTLTFQKIMPDLECAVYALSYNNQDGFFYGLDSLNRLLKIDVNGTLEILGRPYLEENPQVLLPKPYKLWTASEIVDNQLYIYETLTDTLYSIDLSNHTDLYYNTIQLPKSLSIYSWAYNPKTLHLYGITTEGQVMEIEPTNGAIRHLPKQRNLPRRHCEIRAIWFDKEGRFFAYETRKRQLFEIFLEENSAAQITRTLPPLAICGSTACFEAQSPVFFHRERLAWNLERRSAERIQLSWAMVREELNRNYKVERSYDGINWKTIVERNSSRQLNRISPYGHPDPVNLQTEKTYYRLLVERDFGGIEYSPTIREHSATADNFTYWVTPTFTRGDLQLNLLKGKNKQFEIRVVDIHGRVQSELSFGVYEDDYTLSLPTLSLEQGFYWIELKDVTNGAFYYTKILKWNY
ncbi:MAG: hypothetical protein MK212_04585 [Saprospiraceae bacterium]|nr:hypothetical protein [Saprospiraceae bacterium]